MELLKGDLRTPIDLAEAYPWPPGPWTRAMMLTTLNGAIAGPDGRSGSISSDTDHLIFGEARRLADAILVGAGTVRAEGYHAVRARPEYEQARSAAGLKPAPVLVIVSRSLELPWQDPLFSEAYQQPIVLTDTDDRPGQPSAAPPGSDVERLPDLDGATIIGALRSRGLARIVCEGGPQLLTALAVADQIDEYDVAIAPLLTGTGQGIVNGPMGDIKRLRLTQVIADDGFVFAKYLRRP